MVKTDSTHVGGLGSILSAGSKLNVSWPLLPDRRDFRISLKKVVVPLSLWASKRSLKVSKDT